MPANLDVTDCGEHGAVLLFWANRVSRCGFLYHAVHHSKVYDNSMSPSDNSKIALVVVCVSCSTLLLCFDGVHGKSYPA